MALAFVLALTACATAAPINAPLAGPPQDVRGRAPAGEDLIILALSGGGARAASFHLGVLRAMRETPGRDGRPLTEHVALITSVSGGSVLAAYYALHGEHGLDTFEQAYLAQDWRVRRGGSPAAWAGALRGGMNGPAQLADWLDAHVYDGARMSALGAGPRVIVNATDLYNATPFAFTRFFFDGICSDLANVRVADAVAASMAAPVMFRPVLLRSDPEACAGPPPPWTARVLGDRTQPENLRQLARAFRNYRGDTPAAQRYVHLTDGGVADNFGLLSLQLMREAEGPPAPLTVAEALQARRILLLVVNAEYIRPRTFQTEGADAIGAYEMLYSPLDVATDVAKREAVDLWRAELAAFERELRAYRCALPIETRGGVRCDDLSVAMDVITFHDMAPAEYEALYDTATDVSLPADTVSALIAAGQGVARRNAALAALRG